jgi:hypothetical protein
MAKRTILTAARLRELLHYDPKTGRFTWLVQNASKSWPRVGTKHDAKGYIRIGIDNRKYLAHRLAWLYMTGSWPKSDVDHINRRPGDNRWRNLRVVTRAQNNLNSIRSDGIRGVHWDKRIKRWVVRLHIGTYASKSEAKRIALSHQRKHSV